MGINYNKLRKLLSVENWLAADIETSILIAHIALESKPLKARKSTKENLLAQSGGTGIFHTHYQDIKYIDYEELKTIDSLWIKYSQERFGFSIQKKAWQLLEEDFEALASSLGWKSLWFIEQSFICNEHHNEAYNIQQKLLDNSWFVGNNIGVVDHKEKYLEPDKNRKYFYLDIIPPKGYFPRDFYYFNGNKELCDNYFTSLVSRLKE